MSSTESKRESERERKEREMEVDRDPATMSDMLLVLFEEAEAAAGWAHGCFDDAAADEDDDGRSLDSGEGKAFWEEQHLLLQESLNRSSSIEKRIRTSTEEALRKMQPCGPACRCSDSASCRDCALREITQHLKDGGHNSALCRSKWRRSPDIPSGEHSYVDVLVNKKGNSVMRVVIELSFRAEFEMARASEEYNALVRRLPAVFIGRSERLRDVVRVMCTAAKRSMKDNRMHLGPWRKHKYMQSKWLGTCERMPAGNPALPAGVVDRRPKLRASMLTFDLHCTTAVEVG